MEGLTLFLKFRKANALSKSDRIKKVIQSYSCSHSSFTVVLVSSLDVILNENVPCLLDLLSEQNHSGQHILLSVNYSSRVSFSKKNLHLAAMSNKRHIFIVYDFLKLWWRYSFLCRFIQWKHRKGEFYPGGIVTVRDFRVTEKKTAPQNIFVLFKRKTWH